MKKNLKYGDIIKWSSGEFYQLLDANDDGIELYWFSDKNVHFYGDNISFLNNHSDVYLATSEEIAKLTPYVPVPNTQIIYNYLIL